MSSKRIVKVESILNTQIPSFLSTESPLFQEFLSQYYKSQSHLTGISNIVDSLSEYKNIDTYSTNTFYTAKQENRCYLAEDVFTYDDIIYVNSTEGFPNKYGLIKIDDEIITYLSKTDVSFVDCYRGFSGISKIEDISDETGLVFSETTASEHTSKTTVQNLNLVFFNKLFEKFKAHYFPDFETREFNSKIDLELILNRARDFYLSKGTDISFNILFELLYGDSISIFKPQNLVIKASSNNTLTTKNILVEPIDSSFNISDLIGQTIYQNKDDVIASASIYNIEFRPTDNLNLYEISLDSESFVYDFSPSRKTSIIELVGDGILVDSTIGFKSSGILIIKYKDAAGNIDFGELTYSGKTLNKFTGVSNLEELGLNPGDELIEDNLLYIQTGNGDLKFRLINVIESFDFSESYLSIVNDKINIVSFGENLAEEPEYFSWIYNYPTYHKIKSLTSTTITLYDAVDLRINEVIDIIYSTGDKATTTITGIINKNEFQIPNISIIGDIGNITLRRKVEKSTLNPNEPSYIQNTYINQDNGNLIVASSGIPKYLNDDVVLNPYEFNIRNTEADSNIFAVSSSNNMLSGTKVYLNTNIGEVKAGYYFVKVISRNRICLFMSSGDLYLSVINNDNSFAVSGIGSGVITLFGYERENQNFSNQLFLKEFEVKTTLKMNKATLSGKIYNIEDAYNEF